MGVSTRTAEFLPRMRVHEMGDQATMAPVDDFAGTLGETYTSACRSAILISESSNTRVENLSNSCRGKNEDKFEASYLVPSMKFE